MRGNDDIIKKVDKRMRGWYGVRTVVHHVHRGTYEERVTILQAESSVQAIELGEREVAEYAEDLGAVATDLVQVYGPLSEEPGERCEVFSLIRSSRLAPAAYVDAFFDTGDEHQQSA
jgi:hypothetical protein